MAEDQQSSGDVSDQGAAGDGSRQRLVIVEPEPGAVHLGDNVHHGSELIVPAGHTWAVQGDVRIGDGAVLKSEDGATLQVKTPPSAGLVLRAAPASSADDRQGGQGKRVMILRAPAELEPGELEGMRERIKRYLLEAEPTEAEQQQLEQIKRQVLEAEPTEAKRQQLERIKRYLLEGEPTEAEQQRLERLKAEADRFALGISPADAEWLRAQIDNPFLFSPDDARQMAAQFTSGIAPAAIQAYATELARPPRPLLGESWTEYQSEWAESIRRALEPAALGMAFQMQAAASEAIKQALEPTALHMMNDAVEMLRGQGKAIAESFASFSQPFDLNIARGALSDLQIARGALSDLSVVQNALSEFAEAAKRQSDAERRVAGALKEAARWQSDLDMATRALGAYRITQAGVLVEIAPRPKPQPSAERVQVVHLAPGNWREGISHLVTSGQVSLQEIVSHLADMIDAKPGPKTGESWTEAEVVALWLDWVQNQRKYTSEEQARRWNISKSHMYYLFNQYGLKRKT